MKVYSITSSPVPLKVTPIGNRLYRIAEDETKVTMPFIVSSGVPFNQITIKFTGTSADTSIYDADVFFYAEEVVEP